MRLGDLDALSAFVGDLRSTLHKEQSTFKAMTQSEFEIKDNMYLNFQYAIDNAPTFDITKNQAYDQGFITAMRLYSRPQGKCKGEFQLTELRRWLTSQGYSEGTVDDKINEFTRFVEKIRGEEE